MDARLGVFNQRGSQLLAGGFAGQPACDHVDAIAHLAAFRSE